MTFSNESDAVATPEGDNEFDPSAPLTPSAIGSTVDGLQTPRGNAPAEYEKDKPAEHGGLLEAIDELSRGKMQT